MIFFWLTSVLLSPKESIISFLISHIGAFIQKLCGTLKSKLQKHWSFTLKLVPKHVFKRLRVQMYKLLDCGMSKSSPSFPSERYLVLIARLPCLLKTTS